MSRSYRHTPVRGYYFTPRLSERWSKQNWHRRMRARSRIQLHNVDAESWLLPHEREVSNVWAMAKDGKVRFDPSEHPHWLRK